MQPYSGSEPVLDQLRAHRALGASPPEELAWLAARGQRFEFTRGETLVGKDDIIQDQPHIGLWIVFSGKIAVFVDRGAGPKRVADWSAGDVTGMLPYSRIVKSAGHTRALESGVMLEVERFAFPEMIRECPVVTASLVHVMIDRARTFTSSELQDDKMVSLGKLAAGLAHELNNPASAVVRSAGQLDEDLVELAAAARDVGSANFSETQRTALDKFRERCADRMRDAVPSPIALLDAEDAITDWLSARGVDAGLAPALAGAGVTVADLAVLGDDALFASASQLAVAVRWIAVDCATRSLVSVVRQSAHRIADLVGAVKRFTYMDRAKTEDAVDVAEGIRDTVTVLRSKALAREGSVTLDLPRDLPKVRGVGGELNQVWLNLIDNALDAAAERGRVDVSARVDLEHIHVVVADDGAGVPPELCERIFEPFFTTKPVGSGTGLGLDIARRLVRRHGGDIELNSRPGRTEFRVVLPVMATE